MKEICSGKAGLKTITVEDSVKADYDEPSLNIYLLQYLNGIGKIFPAE